MITVKMVLEVLAYVIRKTINSLKTNLGLKVAWLMEHCGCPTLFKLAGLWRYETLDTHGTLRSTFNGTILSFDLSGRSINRNSGVFSAGMNTLLSDCWSFYADYQFEAGDRYMINYLGLGWSYVF